MKRFFLIRYLLAGNAARRLRNLYRLAKHSDSKIRRHVAENPACPPDLLAVLAQDTHPDVRMAAALNSNTDVETRIFLSTDDNPDVRFRIASTSYMPIAVLSALATDENPYVQARAKQTLSRMEKDSDKEVTTRWQKSDWIR